MTGAFLLIPRYDWCAALSHPSSCLRVNHGPSQQSSEKEYKPWNEVLPQDTTHLLQRPCYQRGSPCQDPAGTRTTRRPHDHGKETQTAVVWSCVKFIRSGQNHPARHSERGKKTRQIEEEVGRQHQGMDRPAVRKVQEGSGEQGKMEETGCKNICGAPTTLAVKGLMMMMMLMMMISSRFLECRFPEFFYLKRYAWKRPSQADQYERLNLCRFYEFRFPVSHKVVWTLKSGGTS